MPRKVKEKKIGRGNVPRKGKKKKKNWQRQCASAHGDFRSLSRPIFFL